MLCRRGSANCTAFTATTAHLSLDAAMSSPAASSVGRGGRPTPPNSDLHTIQDLGLRFPLAFRRPTRSSMRRVCTNPLSGNGMHTYPSPKLSKYIPRSYMARARYVHDASASPISLFSHWLAAFSSSSAVTDCLWCSQYCCCCRRVPHSAAPSNRRISHGYIPVRRNAL